MSHFGLKSINHNLKSVIALRVSKAKFIDENCVRLFLHRRRRRE